MTDREVFLRCAEMLSGTGIREISRLVKDAKEMTEHALSYSDEDKGAAKAAPARRTSSSVNL